MNPNPELAEIVRAINRPESPKIADLIEAGSADLDDVRAYAAGYVPEARHDMPWVEANRRVLDAVGMWADGGTPDLSGLLDEASWAAVQLWATVEAADHYGTIPMDPVKLAQHQFATLPWGDENGLNTILTADPTGPEGMAVETWGRTLSRLSEGGAPNAPWLFQTDMRNRDARFTSDSKRRTPSLLLVLVTLAVVLVAALIALI